MTDIERKYSTLAFKNTCEFFIKYYIMNIYNTAILIMYLTRACTLISCSVFIEIMYDTFGSYCL